MENVSVGKAENFMKYCHTSKTIGTYQIPKSFLKDKVLIVAIHLSEMLDLPIKFVLFPAGCKNKIKLLFEKGTKARAQNCQEVIQPHQTADQSLLCY